MSEEKYEGYAEEMINSLEDIMGRFPGHRRAHARGRVYRGIFKPVGTGVNLSCSPLFQNKETEAIIRFSHSSPDPTMADSLSPIKGLAVKFQLTDGSEINSVAATVSIFVTKEPEAFLDMVRIGRTMKKGKPRLTEMVKLIRKYPESKAALKLYRKVEAPSNFAAGTYYAIHTFYLVDANGRKTPVKFIWVPAEKVKDLDKPHNNMEEELDLRLEDGPVQFDLIAQIGEAGDPVDDPTVEWPEEREKIKMGSLQIQEKLLNNNEEDLLFDPTVTGEGIQCSGDKILNSRKHLYSASHTRRKYQN